MEQKFKSTTQPQLQHIEPLFTLHAGNTLNSTTNSNNHAVSSICFVRNTNSHYADDDSDSDSDSEDDIKLRCSNLVLKPNDRQKEASQAATTAASLALHGALLASCHVNGDALLWDLSTRRIVCTFGNDDDSHRGRGPGLALRKLSDDNDNHSKFMYQTRGEGGTVSIHDLQSTTVKSILQLTTHSRTFCTASPCTNNVNLIALPSIRDSWATIRDLRVDPTHTPVCMIHGAGLVSCRHDWSLGSVEEEERRHGMLTSLSMVDSSDDCSRPVLGCGMESGSVFFHDLGMIGKSLPQKEESTTKWFHMPQPPCCSVKISRDPVLALDIVPSEQRKTIGENKYQKVTSVVAVAGCAGDALDLCDLPEEERGTISIIKTSIKDVTCANSSTTKDDISYEKTPNNNITTTMKASIRNKVSTCEIGQESAGGKPGVSTARFRPDGRMFAIGGWDKRLRIYGRSQGNLLAILKGHEDSVNAVDWAEDSNVSGVLATGSGDGRILLWRVFPHSKKNVFLER
uniref:Anaphase-promoting complex subunit 4 WD40 domain-containing protein n=1 Tax=Ditylum brightwellii TaxID=49249 RepID=A0A7S2A1D3_9STRA|mmetsp:Transcript_6383/g.9679  ORF Transcript_6383/g.9679 Transcript_6383/m.9679 type:complete len:514 (+) Transcript_6383:51-1592(+)